MLRVGLEMGSSRAVDRETLSRQYSGHTRPCGASNHIIIKCMDHMYVHIHASLWTINVHAYIHTSLCMYACAHMDHMYVYMHTSLWIILCMCTYMSAYGPYVCVHTCTPAYEPYVCVHTCTPAYGPYVCVHLHTSLWTIHMCTYTPAYRPYVCTHIYMPTLWMETRVI